MSKNTRNEQINHGEMDSIDFKCNKKCKYGINKKKLISIIIHKIQLKGEDRCALSGRQQV